MTMDQLEGEDERDGPADQARRPTLDDIARIARVSTATASRALSNPHMVAAKTREAVLDAAARTGYRTNLLARSLRKQASHAVLVLVPNLSNQFYPEIIRGIEQVAHERDYAVMLGFTAHEASREMSYVDLVRRRRADGILILDASLRNLFTAGEAFSLPAVQVIERMPGVALPFVKIDDHAAALEAVRHLTGLGHRRIAHLMGRTRYSVTPDRFAGYAQALAEAGLALDLTLIGEGDFNFGRGMDAADLLMRQADPPTAIFCANDDSALGAMKRLADLGLSVPRDVSVVGFDDIEAAASAEPPLTTIHQPRFELGATAMRMLIDILEGRPLASHEVVLSTGLIRRASTAPPRTVTGGLDEAAHR
jgi:LacI family transcriptional regulator, repressor for deo operon, udp, cdd, tsx, nupC, and nupG